MALVVAGLTDRGTKRKTNEDAIGWHLSTDGRSALAVVADGMGGYEGGEIASQLAVTTIMDALTTELDHPDLCATDIEERIQDAIALASERLQDRRTTDPALSKMGTTLVMVWVRDRTAHIAHIGDSRCYRLSDDGAEQQTRDDSVVQNMIEDGSITEADAPRVPFRNVLTRALGSPRDIRASLRQLSLRPGERLLLCSDGLTNSLPDGSWSGIIRSEDAPETQVHQLVAASLQQQAEDNVSVVLIQSS